MVSGVFPVPPSATFPTLITIGLVFFGIVAAILGILLTILFYEYIIN